MQLIEFIMRMKMNAGGRIFFMKPRTSDQQVNSLLLYHLSYAGLLREIYEYYLFLFYASVISNQDEIFV